MTKWVFITGGVLSGLGKGIVSASVSKLLQARGYTVVPIKCDGYLNVDPGTMNPHEHGEVFVMDDGGEVDMDFGHYERFLDINTTADWNLTAGKVFKSVIDAERAGDFLGETVQIVPHVTDEIKTRFETIAAKQNADVVMIEVGGTVGDIENQVYLETIRQLIQDKDDTALIHLTLVPYLETVGEQKTKPTQHSVKELRSVGLAPDFIIGRSEDPLEDTTKEKIALFCDVPSEHVISDPDIANIYRLPLAFEDESLDDLLASHLGLDEAKDALTHWERLVDNMEHPENEVTIAIAGKYTDMDDSYASIVEALRHAGAHQRTDINVKLVPVTDIEDGKPPRKVLSGASGVVIAPGFGDRGTEGKIGVAKYCRVNDVPTLGICFGLQMMVAEYARNVCGIEDAHSAEVSDEATAVVDVMPEQKNVAEKGGTMRLGGYTAHLTDGTRTRELYETEIVRERHRHRYEVNPQYHETLQDYGLVFAGTSDDGRLVEFIELPDHPFYLATQAHPEFTSRFEAPNPLYDGFVAAARDTEQR